MINDYSELIIEAARRSNVEDVGERGAQLVGLAEKMIARKLRTADVEHHLPIYMGINTNGILPKDFVEIKEVFIKGEPIKRITYQQYREEKENGYAILKKWFFSTYPIGYHDLTYYGALPSLEQHGTNDLLKSEPEIYLQAVLFQIYSAENDIEKASATAAYLNMLIEEANQNHNANQNINREINFKGIIP